MRSVSVLLLVLAAIAAKAQNVQLHYDLGHNLYEELSSRPSVTTTIEMYKPDKWGNTFFFTDIDYFHDGAAGAYWEIAREFNICRQGRWAAHVEYDGGLSSSQTDNGATRFQHAFLAGPAFNWASPDFSRTFSLQAMYKYYFKGQHPWNRPFSSFQATGVWSLAFAGRRCTFSGFIDCWYDARVRGHWITMAEPQWWLNLNALRGMEDINLSIGTEVEVSNDFVWDKYGRNDRFYAIPTLAAKWSF